MEYVALQSFHMFQKKPQLLCLNSRNNVKSVLYGPYACKCMSDRADTAYSAAYPRRVFPSLANKQCLEKSWCFNDLPFCLLKLAVIYFNMDIPVSFDACEVIDVYISGYFHRSLFSISGFFEMPLCILKNRRSIQDGP